MICKRKHSILTLWISLALITKAHGFGSLSCYTGECTLQDTEGCRTQNMCSRCETVIRDGPNVKQKRACGIMDADVFCDKMPPTITAANRGTACCTTDFCNGIWGPASYNSATNNVVKPPTYGIPDTSGGTSNGGGLGSNGAGSGLSCYNGFCPLENTQNCQKIRNCRRCERDMSASGVTGQVLRSCSIFTMDEMPCLPGRICCDTNDCNGVPKANGAGKKATYNGAVSLTLTLLPAFVVFFRQCQLLHSLHADNF